MTKESLIALVTERLETNDQAQQRVAELRAQLPFLSNHCLLDESFITFAERVVNDEQVRTTLEEIGESSMISVVDSTALKLLSPVLGINADSPMGVNPAGAVFIIAEATPNDIRKFLEMPATPATASTTALDECGA